MSNQGFRKDLEKLINTYTLENVSDTPDFILAQLMIKALEAFEHAANERDAWRNYGDLLDKNDRMKKALEEIWQKVDTQEVSKNWIVLRALRALGKDDAPEHQHRHRFKGKDLDTVLNGLKSTGKVIIGGDIESK